MVRCEVSLRRAGADDGSCAGATTFPGLTEAFTLHRNSTQAKREAERIVVVLGNAAKRLKK